VAVTSGQLVRVGTEYLPLETTSTRWGTFTFEDEDKVSPARALMQRSVLAQRSGAPARDELRAWLDRRKSRHPWRVGIP
jgi:hypothetical protein